MSSLMRILNYIKEDTAEANSEISEDFKLLQN